MCANFKKAFNKKDINVPNSILEQLNKDLPNGLQYTSLKDGTCIILPDNINKIIKKEAFIIPKHLKDKNMEEILQYIYNSQESLKFKDKIPVGNDVFNTKDIVKFPFSTWETSDGDLILTPSEFKEFNIELEAYEVKKSIIVKRQPSKDISKIVFKRIDFNDMDFGYIFDLSNSKVKFNLNVNFENCNSIELLLENLKLYKAFSKGTLKIATINLSDKDYKFETDTNKDAIDDMIVFYEKVLKISKLIDLEIKPKESISKTDIYSVEELYRTLIDEEPYKEYINIDKLNITMNKDIDKELFLENEGFAFQASCDCEWNILGSSITLPSIVVIYNIIATDIREQHSTNEINYELDLKNIKGKKIYKTSIHFKDKESHDDYIQNSENIVETLKDAAEINI